MRACYEKVFSSSKFRGSFWWQIFRLIKCTQDVLLAFSLNYQLKWTQWKKKSFSNLLSDTNVKVCPMTTIWGFYMMTIWGQWYEKGLQGMKLKFNPENFSISMRKRLNFSSFQWIWTRINSFREKIYLKGKINQKEKEIYLKATWNDFFFLN